MKATTVLAAAAVLAFASPALAQKAPPAPQPAAEIGDLEGLLNENIVTTASKTAQTGSSAPATSVTLTAEDLRRYGIHTVAEAIQFLSLGGSVSEVGEVGARGLHMAEDRGSHVLLLVNGHAVNEQLFGSARFDRGMGMPLEMIDHIEFILGPGSVLYGSNAMFGVINVVTKSASATPKAYVVGESELVTSWRVGAGGGREFQFFGKPASLTIGLEYYQADYPSQSLPLQPVSDDPVTAAPWRAGRNGPYGFWGGPNDGYDLRIPSGHLRLKWKDFELNGGASLYRVNAPTGHSRRFEPNGSNYNDPENYQTDLRVWADAKQRARVATNAELTARLYADSFEYHRYNNVSAKYYCQYSGVDTCQKETLGLSRWAGSEVQLAFDWFNDETFTTLLGVDGRIRYSGHKVDQRNADTDEPLESSTSVLSKTDGIVGAYAQQTWQPVPVFGLNAGARFDAYTAFGSHVSPRLAANLSPWRGGTLKAIYSEAYRAPTWYEAELTNAAQIKAKDLDAETVRSVELSLDQKLGTHRLIFGGFRSWWNDLIQLQTLSGDELREAQRNGEAPFSIFAASQFRNVTSIDSYGYNAGYEGTLASGRLHLGLNVTEAFSRQQQPGRVDAPVPLAPSIFGNARVAYTLPGDWPTLGIAARLSGRRAVDAALDPLFVNPPYAKPQLELRGTVSGVVPGVRGLSYRVSANYAFSKHGAYTTGVLRPDPLLGLVDRFRVTVGLQYDF